MTAVDLDRLPWHVANVKPVPAKPRKEDMPARWRERSDLAGYAACSRQGRLDGSMRYDIISDVFPNPEQAHHARKFLAQKRPVSGVDYVVAEIRELM